MDLAQQQDQSSIDLLADVPDYLPQPFDSETIYSWCSRYHRLRGGVDPRQTSRQLFGHAAAGLRHDLPYYLDRFHQNIGGILGSLPEIIYERTLFGFHAPFLSDAITNQVIRALCDGRGALAWAALGLLKCGFNIPAPLKACPDCVKEQQEAKNVAWWQLEHQWPTVRVCAMHQKLLLVVREDLHASIVKRWSLPSDLDPCCWQVAPEFSPATASQLKTIAEWTHALVDRPDLRLDGALLRHTYLLQAKTHAWVAMDGSLRFQLLRDSFQEAYSNIAHLPGLAFLNDVTGCNGGFLGLLLRGYPGARHPMKHIVLMTFLFAEPKEFLERYSEVKAITDADGIEGVVKRLTDTRARIREMVGVESRSVNSVCLELGIAPIQAIRHLKKAGVPYQRRPRVLTPEIEKTLIELLKCGDDHQHIATTLKIRTSFIRTYLATHLELRTAWEVAHEAQRAAKYRKHFLKILQDNPGVPIKRIRRIPGNGFEWLYRNDRDWLARHLPAIWRR